MGALKQKISNYCDELINKIDVQTEKCLDDLSKRPNEQDEILAVNSQRDELLKKIKEFEAMNLQKITVDSKDIFQDNFCFLIENYKMIIDNEEKGEPQFHIFGPAYRFHFENKIGKLVFVNKYLTENTIFELNEIINQKRINFRKDEKNLSSFQELVEISILLDLLEKKFDERKIVIDLTCVSKSKMEQFDIKCDKLEDIKDTDFDTLEKFVDVDSIREFHFSHNLLTRIPAKIFKNFKHLTDLDLNCQNIECLVENNFSYLENLTTLTIINCSLYSLEKNVFNGLKNLKFLILTMNYIEEVDSDILNGLESLEHLNMSQNVIEEINENTFKGLKNLSSLIFTDNRIENLRANCFNGIENLKSLDINYNKNNLKIESTVFDSMSVLEELDLGNNLIENLDKNILMGAKNLKFLNLRNNLLKDLDFLKFAERLEFLDICGTQMTHLVNMFDQIENLPSLRFLILNAEKVPKMSVNLKNLKGLEVNSVVVFEDNAFQELVNLDYLKITIKDDQVIEQLNSGHFNGLKKLKYFSIETDTIGPRAIERFRNKEDVFLNLFESDTELDHRVFYLNFNDSNILVAEIKNCESEKIYFEEILDVSPEVKNSILRSFYADHDFCSNRLRNHNFMNF